MKNKRIRTASKNTTPQYETDEWGDATNEINDQTSLKDLIDDAEVVDNKNINLKEPANLKSRFNSEDKALGADVPELDENLENNDITDNQLKENFNIKDAIIYSEILKPKF